MHMISPAPFVSGLMALVLVTACTGNAPTGASPGPASVAPKAPATVAPTAPATVASAPASAAPAAPTALDPVVTPFLTMQEALAADSATGVADAAKALATAARAAAKPELTAVADLADKVAAAAAGTPDLKAVREAFKPLGNAMSTAVLAAPDAKAAYGVVFCPMANASWVQRGRDVHNPYYGKSMLTCGELKN